MSDRRRSSPPPALEGAPAEVQGANEVLRLIFLAMFEAGFTQAEFADRIGVSERTIENWRAPTAMRADQKGPGIILLSRALHALGYELDVRPIDDPKRFPLSFRNAVVEDERKRVARGKSEAEWRKEHEEWAESRRRMGLVPDDD